MPVPAPASSRLLLVTGATGLVGSHVVERAIADGWRVRALVRPNADASFLQQLGCDRATGGLDDAGSLRAAVRDVTHIVHCAAKVGDWGPVDEYRRVNVDGLRELLDAALATGQLQQFVHVSSLGVYPARDHYGTDESAPVAEASIDGYTRSKVESESLFLQACKVRGLTGVALRPGFIYGPRDRTVLPQLVSRLRQGKVVYLGSGDQLLNNTYVSNLVDAIFLALERPDLTGQVFNITDGRLASRKEFLETVCRLAELPPPKKHVPLGVAKSLATFLETLARWRRATAAPLLSQARVKFLGLNLDFCIDKAQHDLGYKPRFDFQQGMTETMAWARGALPPA